MNEDRERFIAPQSLLDSRRRQSSSCLEIHFDEKEGSADRQLYLVWCRGSGLHTDGDVCRNGYTAASATEEFKAGSR